VINQLIVILIDVLTPRYTASGIIIIIMTDIGEHWVHSHSASATNSLLREDG